MLHAVHAVHAVVLVRNSNACYLGRTVYHNQVRRPEVPVSTNRWAAPLASLASLVFCMKCVATYMMWFWLPPPGSWKPHSQFSHSVVMFWATMCPYLYSQTANVRWDVWQRILPYCLTHSRRE